MSSLERELIYEYDDREFSLSLSLPPLTWMESGALLRQSTGAWALHIDGEVFNCKVSPSKSFIWTIDP